MNGRRAKALRRAWKEKTGEFPDRMEILSEDIKTGMVSYKTSEWRKIKKAYKKERQA